MDLLDTSRSIPRNLPWLRPLCAAIASVHAGAENRADVNVQPSGALCQREICHFHRYLLVFFGFVPF